MKKVLIFALLQFWCMAAIRHTRTAEPNLLDQLIKTTDAAKQREILHGIAKNKTAYSLRLAQKLESCYKQKRPLKEIETLLYVAALIKSKEAIPILEKIWLDQSSIEHDCVYCCPRSLVMTVFGIHGLWKPPQLSDEQLKTDQVENTLSDLKRYKDQPSYIPSGNEPYFQGTDEYALLAKQYASIKDEDLLRITTDSKAEYPQRYAASIELRRRVADDHLLVDYYWWAMNAFDDASGECLCKANESILSAERYQRKRTTAH
jgi:hypothetical protein